MAKIKISELANELGHESKELVSYLQEQGVESVKRSTSSIDDDMADKVRNHFGNKNESNSNIKKEEKVAEAPKEKNTAEVKNAETQPAKKKKKIILVTNPNNSKMGGFHNDNNSGNNNNNNNGNNNRRSQNNNNRNNRNTFAQSQNAYRPIKPLTAPSQLESYNTEIPKYNENKSSKPKQAEKPAVAETKPVKETTVETTNAATTAKPATEKHENRGDNRNFKSDRNDNRNSRGDNRNDRGNRNSGNNQNGRGNYNNNKNDGSTGDTRNGQGGRSSQRNGQNNGFRGNNGQGGMNGRPSFGNRNNDGKSFGQGGRSGQDSRGGQGRKFDKGGSGFASADMPLKGTDKHGRDEEKRRSAKDQDRDKRSKKDLVYEEDDMPRSKKVGRFIKPEVKKVEEPEEQIKVITIPEKLTIKELAEKMKMQPSAIIKKLFLAGQIVTVNSELSYEEAENIAIDYEIICEKEVQVDVIEELLKEDEDAEDTLVKRPPVVCVMGHVDHGKTSLLDAIRETSVTDKEAGGITQRIGAYTVSVDDQKITFLDTPGHEAFTAMRMRGANSTDIAVLVVAADDGVMPQTIEAINHAKAAEVEIIVAVNKIDKPNANIDRVKQEMTEYGLIATDWGGTTEFVPVSAKTGEGIDTLLETILLTADILELKANPNRQARGLVLEARLDKGRGPVANILVQKGTLHVGDFISAGASHGKVRAMVDDKGNRLKEAKPSQPVEILGLSDVPNAGEVFIAHENDKSAKQFADTYLQQHKKDLIEETKAKMSLDELYSKIEEGKLKELDIIIKADVQGSAEALKQSLVKLSNEEVVVKVIHCGVGTITESDVSLAAASSAIIIGFDVRIDSMTKSMAEHEGVEVKIYKVIYQAIEDIDNAMKGMLAPVYEEKVTGHAEIRQIFKASKLGNIAGSFVLDGNIQKDCMVRVTRGDEQVFEGKLASLKRFKDDVKEVKEGYECGLVFEDFDQIQVDDKVEAYIMVEVPRT